MEGDLVRVVAEAGFRESWKRPDFRPESSIVSGEIEALGGRGRDVLREFSSNT